MPIADEVDDDYVIKLLKHDAEVTQKRYITNGLGSVLSNGRRRTDAPKPNTRFLKQIIKETDSHNAALKAKEVVDAKAKLRDFKREQRRGKRKRDEAGMEERSVRPRVDGERAGRWVNALGGLGDRPDKRHQGLAAVDRSVDRRVPTGHEGRLEIKSDATTDRDNPTFEASPQIISSQGVRTKHGRRRDTSDVRPLNRGHRSDKRRRSPSDGPHDRSKRSKYSDPHVAESDLLEEIIGPALPPEALPRGRGAFKPSSMDSRFQANYDPRIDVSLAQDELDEDWNTSLEATWERAKWRVQGADRLRAAGFTDDEVQKWEKGRVEKDVDDVRWKMKGEGREWDRGKVVDETGEVEVKAKWGELKDS